jgi:predicted nucleic acid-binding protein
VQAGTLEVISSELALMETLVLPLRKSDAALVAAYEGFFQQPGVHLIPISTAILKEAARVRATTSLRTPDAIHAATAGQSGCALFLTNDYGFRAAAALPLVILQDLLTP